MTFMEYERDCTTKILWKNRTYQYSSRHLADQYSPEKEQFNQYQALPTTCWHFINHVFVTRISVINYTRLNRPFLFDWNSCWKKKDISLTLLIQPNLELKHLLIGHHAWLLLCTAKGSYARQHWTSTFQVTQRTISVTDILFKHSWAAVKN